MKRKVFRMLFVLAFFVFCCTYLHSADVSLEWDASVSTVEGYALFNRDFQHPYDYNNPIWQGPELTCTVTVADDRQTAFVARAWVYGLYDLDGNRTVIWSDNSNEAVYVPDSPVIEPPRNIMVRILVAIVRAISHFFV